MRPISRETIIDRRQPLMRWSAVFAGTALAVGLWILFQTLGMGLGLAAVDVDDSGNLKGIGIGTGIWSVIAPLLAMFLGAFLAGRLAGTRDKRVGAMHGSVMWALATAVGLWAVLSLVGALASGVAQVGGAAASATGAVVSGAAKAGGKLDAGDAMSALGIDTNDLVAPINERLEAAGKPPITAAQINATVRAVAQRGLHQGRVDREVLVEELAQNTALSRADAEDIATRFGARYEEVANRAQQMGQQIGEKAKAAGLQAADKTGKALLLGGLMMLLSLGAAAAGGALGVRSSVRREGPGGSESYDRTQTATLVTPPAESTIITRPAES
jgi:hypothetical protein